jgi:GNAT superfamily N-acetyltransferase
MLGRVALMSYVLNQIENPDDPQLAMVHSLLAKTLADPNTVLGLDRLREFLSANRPGAPRWFWVLVALAPGGEIVGATIFSYVVASNCGFSEYIVSTRELRGSGIGRQLFDGRKALLDAAAQRHGFESCRGVFIEVDNPDRTPGELIARERETALDAWERWRIFDHLGFRRVDLAYVQPPLGDGKVAVDYMDLMFLAWDAAARDASRIPAAWILETLRVIWSSWAPRPAAVQLALLRPQLGTADVALLPLWG